MVRAIYERWPSDELKLEIVVTILGWSLFGDYAASQDGAATSALAG